MQVGADKNGSEQITQARDNKTAEVERLTNRAVDGFSWSPYLHVMLAACLTNQFSFYI
jgi:hypothetical protein